MAVPGAPGRKLGRASVTHNPLRRKLATTLLESLPEAPAAVDNTNGLTSWGMMGNDTLGDCTCAGLGHSVQIATLNTGGIQTPSTDVVEQAYSTLCGYVAGNPATDQGGNELDILTTLEGSKGGVFGRKLLGFVSPDPKNLDHVKKAIAYFGSVYMGCLLPVNTQTQPVWTPEAQDGGIEGGHCMVNARYDATLIPFITWGKVQPATWDWWLRYVDECHVLLWDVWLRKFPLATQQTLLGMLDGVS